MHSLHVCFSECFKIRMNVSPSSIIAIQMLLALTKFPSSRANAKMALEEMGLIVAVSNV